MIRISGYTITLCLNRKGMTESSRIVNSLVLVSLLGESVNITTDGFSTVKRSDK